MIGGTGIRTREERAASVREDIAYAERMALSWAAAAEGKAANGRDGMAAEDREMAEYWNGKAAEARAELARL